MKLCIHINPWALFSHTFIIMIKIKTIALGFTYNNNENKNNNDSDHHLRIIMLDPSIFYKNKNKCSYITSERNATPSSSNHIKQHNNTTSPPPSPSAYEYSFVQFGYLYGYALPRPKYEFWEENSSTHSREMACRVLLRYIDMHRFLSRRGKLCLVIII